MLHIIICGWKKNPFRSNFLFFLNPTSGHMACNVNFFPLSPFTSIALLSFVPVIFAVKSLKIEKEKLHVKKKEKERAKFITIQCIAVQLKENREEEDKKWKHKAKLVFNISRFSLSPSRLSLCCCFFFSLMHITTAIFKRGAHKKLHCAHKVH